MAIYQHDLASAFRLQILGALRDGTVTELERCWVTARSIMDGKELVVDLRGLTESDEAARALLDRMQAAGARIETARTPTGSGPICSRLQALWRRRGLRPFLHCDE